VETRYSPAECIGCERKRIVGNADPKHISTSYIERQNLNQSAEHEVLHAADQWILKED